MKKIDIQINHAKILNFSVVHGDPLPAVSATIGLFTPNGLKISEYSLSTNHWKESMKFDLPPEVIGPILQITDALERIVTAHCQSQQKLLSVVANGN